jgi:hypothetical protein
VELRHTSHRGLRDDKPAIARSGPRWSPGSLDAFEKQKALPKEGSLVVLREVAGARSVSHYDRARVRESFRMSALSLAPGVSLLRAS